MRLCSRKTSRWLCSVLNTTHNRAIFYMDVHTRVRSDLRDDTRFLNACMFYRTWGVQYLGRFLSCKPSLYRTVRFTGQETTKYCTSHVHGRRAGASVMFSLKRERGRISCLEPNHFVSALCTYSVTGVYDRPGHKVTNLTRAETYLSLSLSLASLSLLSPFLSSSRSLFSVSLFGLSLSVILAGELHRRGSS